MVKDNLEDNVGVVNLEVVISDANLEVNTRESLFLSLCALNYLNSLVKRKEFKGKISYGMIKPKALYLAKDLFRRNLMNICEELVINPEEDCLYIKCYGLQFSFHNVNSKSLGIGFESLFDRNAQWEGVRLQPIAGALYDLAKHAAAVGLGEVIVRERIRLIL